MNTLNDILFRILRNDDSAAFKFVPAWNKKVGCAFATNAPLWFMKAEYEGRARVWGDDEVPYCMVQTPEGLKKAEAGDWIAQYAGGELDVVVVE